jgi:hypothetical protein
MVPCSLIAEDLSVFLGEEECDAQSSIIQSEIYWCMSLFVG